MTDLLALDERTGWPADLRVLLARHPRETWGGHANLGETARFWLKRHDMFRELGAALQAGTHAFREGQIEASPFRAWFLPRLRFYLSELEGHHSIEDRHYFPLFRAAENRLVRGFEVLEHDHDLIHRRLEEVALRGQAFAGAEGDALRRAADLYAAAAERLVGGLSRHLLDEEDLIVPLILDRGEGALGIG